MEQALEDPWLNVLANVIVFGSVGTWVYIASRWWRHGEVLPWEPRRSVPWGPPAAILAVAFALMAVSSAWGPGGAAGDVRVPNAEGTAIKIVSLLAFQLLLAGGFFAAIAVTYGATARDMGLPRSAREGLRDFGLGIATCLAALPPVQAVQALSMWLIGREDPLSQHPLIETLTSMGGANVSIMLLACLSAVVVAPICEEITFRLLLQGWLEKWEDGNLVSSETANAVVSDKVDLNGFQAVDDEMHQETNEPEPATTDSTIVICHSSFPPRPPRGMLGLPHGWLPLLISSFLFGIAHFGYGPEPIPLFFFALFLGYVYQRTHRILPCIIAHGLFNLISMVALWRIIVRLPTN
jgi:membrane protease YdiL (CAAX protease family)